MNVRYLFTVLATAAVSLPVRLSETVRSVSTVLLSLPRQQPGNWWEGVPRRSQRKQRHNERRGGR
mgnify:CR=1 FL=1